MSDKLHRRKILLLFLAISLFGYFAAKKFKDKDISFDNVEANEYVVSENIEASNDSNLNQDVFVQLDESLNPVKIVKPQLVLGEGDTNQCRTPAFTYSSNKICSSSSSNFEYDMGSDTEPEVGAVIKKNSRISLVSVEVPPLYSGSPVMDSEIKQIHKDSEGNYHWTLAPADQIRSRRVVENNTYPGDEKTKALLDAADNSVNKPFSMEYTLEVQGQGEGEGKGDVVVDEYYENNCGAKCDNDSSGSVQKAQVLSEILAKSNERPGYYDDVKKAPEDEQSIESCSNNSLFYDMDIEGTSPDGCATSLKDLVVSFVKRIQNAFDVDACKPGDEGNGECVSTANIVVIMESPFGTTQDCAKNGQCVNEYSNIRKGNTEIPGSDDAKNYYVLTDCTANVEGYGQVGLKCAWDIDYIAKEVEFQSVDNLPGEEYPDTIDYLKFQIDEAEGRTDQPLKM